MPPHPSDLIELPVAGHVCLHGRSGYRVFDFERRSAIKIFPPHVSISTVEREVALARRLGERRIGPVVRDSDVDKGWYEEELINGRPMTPDEWMRMLPILAHVILALDPQEVDALAYAEDLHGRVRRSGFAEPRFQGLGVDRLWEFIDGVIARLREEKPTRIFLVCSHGDFSSSNVLTTGARQVVIDWELAGMRSALYDLHEMFVRRLGAGAESMSIGRAMPVLKASLASVESEHRGPIVTSLESVLAYRLVYFLERVHVYVQRGKVEPNRLSKILSRIEAFARYDASAAVDPSRAQVLGERA